MPYYLCRRRNYWSLHPSVFLFARGLERTESLICLFQQSLLCIGHVPEFGVKLFKRLTVVDSLAKLFGFAVSESLEQTSAIVLWHKVKLTDASEVIRRWRATSGSFLLLIVLLDGCCVQCWLLLLLKWLLRMNRCLSRHSQRSRFCHASSLFFGFLNSRIGFNLSRFLSVASQDKEVVIFVLWVFFVYALVNKVPETDRCGVEFWLDRIYLN